MIKTNKADISISVAAWLAADTYDYDPTAISATGLLKPIRRIVLAPRVSSEFKKDLDVLDIYKSRMGTSVHDAIEGIWKDRVVLERALRYLDTTKHLFKENASFDDIVSINPETPSDKPIVVYLENRVSKEIDGVKVSGKYDFILNGQLEDHKTTSVFTYKKGTKDEDYILQGSIYRWLNPELITSEYIVINFIFTDWKEMGVASEQNYPPFPAMSVKYKLMSIEDTEAWIKNRIATVKAHLKLDQKDLPLCTPEELWQDESSFKYYSDPTKTSGRSTKNFTSLAEANEHLASKGKGIVLEAKGRAKACRYCEAAAICQQYQSLVEQGLAE